MVGKRIKKHAARLSTILFILSFVLSLGAIAPVANVSAVRRVEGYDWGKTFEASSNAWATSVATDSSNNSYIVGNFSGTVDFDPGAGTDSIACPDSYCMFAVKINANDSYAWARVMPNDNYIEPRDAVVSGSNVYVVGEFYGTTDFDPSLGTDSISTVSASGSDMFLTSLTASGGTYVDTQTMGGPDSLSSIQPQSMDIDSNGNIYITGHFYLTVDFNGTDGTDNKTSLGGTDIFLTKINSDLSYGYTYTVGGGHWANADYGWGVAVDGNDNIYIAGQFQGTADVNPTGGIDSQVSAGAADGLIIKINSDATYGYGMKFGSTGTDYATAINTDSTGNVYYAGRLGNSTTVDVDPTGGTQNVVVPGAGQTITLTRIDADATFGWAHNWLAGQSSTVEVDSQNNLYLTGGFSGTVDFDPGAGTDEITAAGSSDAYVLTVAADGTYNGVRSIGGPGASIYSYKAAIDAQDSYYFVGDFYDAGVDFDPGASTNTIAPVGFDAFATKLTLTTYQHIDGLSGGLSAEEVTSGDSVDDEGVDDGILRGNEVTVRVFADGVPIADVSVDFDSDRDWSTVTGDVDTTGGRSFVHNLQSAPGVTDSFTLYVPKLEGSEHVGYCPGASSLEQLTEACAGYAQKTEADMDTEIVTIDGADYWAISEVSGTGGFNVTAANNGGEDSDNDGTGEGGATASDTLADTGSSWALLLFISVFVVLSGSLLTMNLKRKNHA